MPYGETLEEHNLQLKNLKHRNCYMVMADNSSINVYPELNRFRRSTYLGKCLIRNETTYVGFNTIYKFTRGETFNTLNPSHNSLHFLEVDCEVDDIDENDLGETPPSPFRGALMAAPPPFRGALMAEPPPLPPRMEHAAMLPSSPPRQAPAMAYAVASPNYYEENEKGGFYNDPFSGHVEYIPGGRVRYPGPRPGPSGRKSRRRQSRRRQTHRRQTHRRQTRRRRS